MENIQVLKISFKLFYHIIATYGSKSTYKENFKKKVDPYKHRPTLEERKRSEDARVYLEEVTSDYSILYRENTIEMQKLEKIFEGNSAMGYHLIIVVLFLRNKNLMKNSRKY